MSIFNQFKQAETAAKNAEKEHPTLIVDKSRCPQNHACPSVPICPVGALSQSGFNAPTVDMDKCIQCGKCVRFCPKKALILA